jgi:hypothetical protein
VFNLEKWYLDCVTESGEAAVLYWAALRWGVFRLRYGAALHKNGFGDTLERYTPRPGISPRVSESGDLQWVCRALDARGAWIGQTRGFERTLLDSKAGNIHWHCISPRAEAEVSLGNRTLRGMGYAEHLTMTLKPWQLPFEQLRWGRFHSCSDVMVWIEWCGSIECSWVFVNGEELCRARTTPGGVESPDDGVTLAIDDGATLRAGRLVNTALRSLRGVVSLMPGWRIAHETKWLARGSMSAPTGTSDGWVVHEVVQWA